MEENQTQTSRTQSILRFAIVGVILVLLLVAGLYFGKRVMNAEQAQKTPEPSKVADKKTETSAANKKIAQQRAEEQKTAEKEAAAKKEEARKAAEAKKAEEKKKAEAAAAAKSEAQPATPTPAQTPPATTNEALPSTGPVEVIAVLLGLSALSYGSFSFLRSKHELTKVV